MELGTASTTLNGAVGILGDLVGMLGSTAGGVEVTTGSFGSIIQ
jgi:hypothetical protein